MRGGVEGVLLRLWGITAALMACVLASTAQVADAQTMTYDPQGRLSIAAYPDGTQILYCYDFAGNRTQYVVTTGTPACSAVAANAVSTTVVQNSTNNPVTLNIYGGTPTGVAVSTAPSLGTASASGTSITYSPRPGYCAPDSFKYTATNSYGTSYPATVSVTCVPAAGAVLFSSSTAGSWGYTIPAGTPPYVMLYLYGGGGGGRLHGGGGGGFSGKRIAVSPGTVLGGLLGAGGRGDCGTGCPPDDGDTTTLGSPPTMQAGGGGAATSTGGGGGGGTGGDTNITGEAGDTGGTGNGGANLGPGGGPRQIGGSAAGGLSPGGGGAGDNAVDGGAGANGQVIIFVPPLTWSTTTSPCVSNCWGSAVWHAQ